LFKIRPAWASAAEEMNLLRAAKVASETGCSPDSRVSIRGKMDIRMKEHEET
jgi:hypothetical protein